MTARTAQGAGWIIVVVMGVVGAATVGAAPAGPVAILFQPGMISVATQPQIGAADLQAQLAAHGLDAEIIDADTLADPCRFHAAAYPVYVHLYGNAFPVEAFDNLLRYHEQGGCLVSSGVPFCHPCERRADRPAAWHSWVWQAWSDFEPSITWETPGRTGARCVRMRVRPWGPTPGVSERFEVQPGTRLDYGAWVRSAGLRAADDNLIEVRFFGDDGLIGRVGAPLPEQAEDWQLVTGATRVPDGARSADVSLTVRSKQGVVWWDDVTAYEPGRDDNLLANGGFEEPAYKWHDQGGSFRYCGHDGQGLGTGICQESLYGGQQLEIVPDNPLGVTAALVLQRASERPQWLDPATVPADDDLAGIVAVRRDGQVIGYAAAAIRHRCAQFPGATDVWLGTCITGDAQMQMALRATAYCLMTRGLLKPDAYADLLERFAHATPPPRGFDLPARFPTRPHGRVWPASPEPARQPVVVDVRARSHEETLLLRCLQGLVARTRPHLFLVMSPWEERWLGWLQTKGYIDGQRRQDDTATLLAEFADHYRGALLIDDTLWLLPNVAVMVAACEDLLIATPELATRYGLDVKLDLRGRFADNAAAMQWAWDTYRDRLNRDIMLCIHPDCAFARDGIVDYIIAHRGVVFWVTGWNTFLPPGSNSLAETRVVEQMLAESPANVPYGGFWWHGVGPEVAGINELPGVMFAGEYAKPLVAVAGANVSFHSGIRIERLAQVEPLPAPPLERSKVYVTYTNSDGDALSVWLNIIPKWFDSPAHGSVPVGWGMGPTLIDLMPAVAQYYYEHATPADEFFADVSGLAYMYPVTYGCRFADKGKVMDDFLACTDRYLQRMDMHSVRVMGSTRGLVERYARALSGLHSLLPDYGRFGTTFWLAPPSESVYRADTGLPVFHALTPLTLGGGGKEALLKSIREVAAAMPERPAFVNAFVNLWEHDMEGLLWVADNAGPEFVFVTPRQLAVLYQAAYPAATDGEPDRSGR